MKSPDHYQTAARYCRRDALGLAIFAAACALALALMAGVELGEPWRWVRLALSSGLACAALGALNELAEARRLQRIADMEETHQPLERI